MHRCFLPWLCLDLHVYVLLAMLLLRSICWCALFHGLDLHVGVSAAAFSLKERGSTPRPSGPGEEKMESPPRLGLGTIK